jgi:hypothetical protein
MLESPPSDGARKGTIRRLLHDDLPNLLHQRKFLYQQRTRRFPVPSLPHFDAAGLRRFLARLERTRVYLEYGAGGSTLAAAAKVQTLISVESDRFFLKAVRDSLSVRPATLALLPISIGLTGKWGRPIFRTVTRARAKRWARYPRAPWDWIARNNVAHPDTILVDGRFRVACVMASVLYCENPECQILVDDYSQRPEYRAMETCCDLITMCGLMAVFRPKADLDREWLEQQLAAYSRDWW